TSSTRCSPPGTSSGRPWAEMLPLASLAFVGGAIMGSFVGVVADRVPSGRSIMGPRSMCDSCGTQIASYDNVPVLSLLWLRGRRPRGRHRLHERQACGCAQGCDPLRTVPRARRRGWAPGPPAADRRIPERLRPLAALISLGYGVTPARGRWER